MELLPHQLAGEHPMLAGLGGLHDLGDVPGSSSRLGGSPIGPLENRQTGLAAKASPERSTSALAGLSQYPAYTALPSTTTSKLSTALTWSGGTTMAASRAR